MKNVKSPVTLTNFKQRIKPYKGILIFLFIVIACHVVWELAVFTGVRNKSYLKAYQETGKESLIEQSKECTWKLLGVGQPDRTQTNSHYFALFNINLTPYLAQYAAHTAGVCFFILHDVMGQDIARHESYFVTNGQKQGYQTILQYVDGNRAGVNIIWGCTGIKPFFIFLSIMLFYPGNWRKKAYYIPIGLAILWAFNLFRIVFVTWMMKIDPAFFDLVHDEIFRYLFYLLIFALWYYWEEKIDLKPTPSTNKMTAP